MPLLKYFKPTSSHHPNPKNTLTDPTGPLSVEIPSQAIHQSNQKVVDKENSSLNQQRLYKRLSNELPAKIGKYASENGNATALRQFSKECDRPLSENMVHSLKKNYYVQGTEKKVIKVRV